MSVAANVAGLTPETTYYFQVSAKNAVGSYTTVPSSFKTAALAGPPEVTTEAATSVTRTSATLNGTVNPNGDSTNASFCYGTSDTLKKCKKVTIASPGSGNSAVPISTDVTGLAPATTYYFQASATNSGGGNDGAIISFTTAPPAIAPTATTKPATLIGRTTATLNGVVNPKGDATTATFCYGTKANMNGCTVVNPADPGAGTADVNVTWPLTALAPNTTYYFRVSANNAGGTADGSVLNFATSN